MNYRLGDAGRYPVAQQDVANAVLSVHSNIAQYGGDPNRIVLLAHSSGAAFAGRAPNGLVRRLHQWTGITRAAVFRTHANTATAPALARGRPEPGQLEIQTQLDRPHTARAVPSHQDHKPEDAITSVSDSDKLDALAAGTAELPVAPAALGQIGVEGKEGHEPAPTGSTVLMVGACRGALAQHGSCRAQLPCADDVRGRARSRHTAPGAEAPVGNQSIRLIGLPAGEVRTGQSVAVIGFMVRERDATEINVVALKPIAASCTP